MFESAKIQMGWKSNITTLVPIALSSIIACISAMIKFRNFPSQMEILFTIAIFTYAYAHERKKRRRHYTQFIKEYHDSLEKLEVSLYPDIRKQYLIQSHKNLISIIKKEQTYFNTSKSITEGNYIPSSDSSIESNDIELKNRADNI